MYCGPDAVACLTGWTRDQVWMHVRALREQQGKRFGVHPRGGTYASEMVHAIERAGYEVRQVHIPRMRLREFARLYGRDDNYLLRQRGHFFAWQMRDRVGTYGNAIILDAWLVRRRKRTAPATRVHDDGQAVDSGVAVRAAT